MRHSDLRQRLLRAAEQEILAQGLARASLRGIAKRVGVSHQATAHHFDDRAGLFTALAVEGFELLVERTRSVIEAASEGLGEGPGEGLGEGVTEAGRPVAAAGAAYVEFAMRHPTMFDVMFRPELLHVDDPSLVAARQAHRDLMLSTTAAAQERGWGVAVPTEQLAVLGWACVHGLAVLERDSQFDDLAGDLDLAGLLAQVAKALEALG